MWHGVPFACQRRPIVGVLRMCWLLPGSFDCFCCPHTSVHRPSIACLAVFLCGPDALSLHALSGPSTICPFPPHGWSAPDGLPLLLCPPPPVSFPSLLPFPFPREVMPAERPDCPCFTAPCRVHTEEGHFPRRWQGRGAGGSTCAQPPTCVCKPTRPLSSVGSGGEDDTISAGSFRKGCGYGPAAATRP